MTMLEAATPARYQPASAVQLAALDALTTARSQGSALAAAENAAVTAYLGLARSLANRYRNRGLELDDLHQLAFLGLVKAVKRWDPEIGADFVTFAYPVILGEIRRYFRDQYTIIRMPRPLQELHAQTSLVQEDFRQQAGREASVAELATAVGVEIDRIRDAETATARCRVSSLDHPDVYGHAVDRTSDDAATCITNVENRIVLSGAMARLTDRERRLVELRYIQRMSQLQIAGIMGISQMQVSRLLAAIHHKLRDTLQPRNNGATVGELLAS